MGSGRRAGRTSLGLSGLERERRGNRPIESGSLWVEAAFLVPIMFTIVFGTAEVGNFFVQRGSMTNVAQSLAMAIQQKPDITAQELYEFQKSLGGGSTPFFEVKKSDGSPYADSTVKCSASDCRIAGLEVKIASEPSPISSNTVAAVTHSDWSSPHVGKLTGQRNQEWPHSTSPWKRDPNQDASDDGNPYYVGVRVSWINRPLLQSLGFAAVTTSQFAGVLVKPVLGCQDAGTLCGAGFLENTPSRGVYIRANGSQGGNRECKGLTLIDEGSKNALAATRNGRGIASSTPVSSIVKCPVGYHGVLVGYATFPDNNESAQYFHYSCASDGTTCPQLPAPAPVQLPSSPTYGDPVRLKRTPPFDSSPGRGWQDWNNLINHVLLYYMTNQSEASKQYWRDRCYSDNGAVPKSLAEKDSIAFEYCGRWACLYENRGVTMPFMARNLDTCPNGGPSDCNNSKFYISWACLYDTLLP